MSKSLDGVLIKKANQQEHYTEEQIQEFLNRQGYTDLNGNPLEVDGKFGPLTESAVVAFQEANNLSNDGVVGPKTFAQIKFVSADQDRKIDSVVAGFGDESSTREEVLAAIRDRVGVDDAEGLLTDRGIDVNDYATNDDKFYYEYLLNLYKDYKNISFIGPVPHSELANYLKNVSFHINNTDKGFYDKSVLETSINGIINFYKNIDYDKNIPIEYQEALKFDGSSSDLSNKISSVFTLSLIHI